MQRAKKILTVAAILLLVAVCITTISYTVWHHKGTRPLEDITLAALTCRTYAGADFTDHEMPLDDVAFVEQLLRGLVVHGRGKKMAHNTIDGGGYPSLYWTDAQGNTGVLHIVDKYNAADKAVGLCIILSDGLAYTCDAGILETLIGFCEAKCGDGAASP